MPIDKAERGHVVKKKGNVKTFFFSHHANETKDIYTALTEVPDLRIDPTMKTISLAKGGAPLVLIDGIPKSHSLASISPAMIDKVEVSNSVPLEYMGQGYSGVVNIITKILVMILTTPEYPCPIYSKGTLFETSTLSIIAGEILAKE